MQHVLLDPAERDQGLQDEDGEEARTGGAPDGHSRFARMPPGRTNIITMKMTKAITYPISVDMTTPPIAIISLMMNEAMKAPTMFPRPPSTQIMKVSGPNWPPKNGCTAYWKTQQRPGQPRHEPAHRRGDEVDALGLAPIRDMASRSWDTARIAVPM